MDTTNPNPDEAARRQAALLHAAEALHSMRDALVRASLCLQDYQFRLDSTPRRTVAVHAQELIDKARNA